MTVDKTHKMMYNVKITKNTEKTYTMKNRSVKIISLMLALIICIGAFCSCSTNSKTYAKSEGGNKISVAMYSLITSLMKGNDAYYIVQEYGDYNSASYWGQIVDPDTQMTMKEYYQYMIDLKIEYYLAALDLFDELGLELTDEEIAVVDKAMEDFVEYDGNGSKNVLNKEILSKFGANYTTLREYKIMNAKIAKLSLYLYGANASKVSDTLKQTYFEDNYVAFKMILLPTYDYAHNEDKFGNDVYYATDSEGKIKTEQNSSGKKYNVVAYEKNNGMPLDTNGDGKDDVDELGYTIYYTYDDLSIAYDKTNGVTFDNNGDGKDDVDVYGNLIYYKDTATGKIAYDTKNGGIIDFDGDDEFEKDANGDTVYFNYDVAIAYDKTNGVRIEQTDEKGNKVIEQFSKEEKAAVEKKAGEIFALTEAGKYAAFENLISQYDKNYGAESENDRGAMIYLSSSESYTAGNKMMNDMFQKISEAEIGESLIYPSDYGYHIIMRYEPEAAAYEETAYKSYFENFYSNLVNDLFMKKIEPYTEKITFEEKYRDQVDITTIAPNYNFY